MLKSPLSGFRKLFIEEASQVEAFSPLSLFASGEEGAWYDPSDLTTLWTDTAGTTQATVGDAVARMDDKSGNGNHATQATAAARPILRQSGSLYYLEFDGVDDSFVISGSQPWYDQFVGSITIAALTNSTASQDVISNRGNDVPGLNGKYAFSIRNSGIDWIYDNLVVGSGFGLVTASPINTAYVFYGQGDGTNVGASLNGSAITTSADTYSIGNLDAYIGQNGNNGNYFSGNIYGLVLTNDVLSSDERSNTESYLANKSGVTL